MEYKLGFRDGALTTMMMLLLIALAGWMLSI